LIAATFWLIAQQVINE